MSTQDFAAFALRQRGARLPDEIYAAATRATVDWFGATVAGSAMPPAQILRSALSFAEGTGTALLVPSGIRMDLRSAALVNATASHTAEMDDIFREGIYHPGSPTIGAALAAAQHLGASGERFLRAVAIGYEIGDRIAAALQPAHYTYWHTTGTVGTIGAAAAVAELLELDADPYAHALATATTMAAGLQQAFRSDAMSKPLHAGHAADAGLLAALAAGHGYTGALDILEGEVGLGAAMSEDVDWSAAVADLAAPWAITQATVKNHSCCGHTFAGVDAALELRAEGLDVQAIERVTVQTYTTATKVAGYASPTTAFEAKFSLRYCVAAALFLGGVRLAAFTPERLADPQLRSLMDRVTVEADPEFDVDFPARRRARVTVAFHDGTTASSLRNTRKGDPDDPLTDSELREKFDDLVVPLMGPLQARHLSESLWRIVHLTDMRELAPPVSSGRTRTEPLDEHRNQR
jgi:2-methylcitrate dehydratase PrpD